ncbi:Acetyltransferase (GNAT) family protein [compost metagenome]
MVNYLDQISCEAGLFHIRQGQLDDVELIRSLLIEAATWMGTLSFQQWKPDQFTVEEVQSYFHGRDIYLLCSNQEVIGLCTIQDDDPDYWGPLNESGYSYLHRLTVRNRYRGKNLSKELIYWAARRSKEQQRKGLRLDTAAQNEKLNSLYRKLGFKSKGSRQKGDRHYVLYEMDTDLYNSL